MESHDSNVRYSANGSPDGEGLEPKSETHHKGHHKGHHHKGHHHKGHHDHDAAVKESTQSSEVYNDDEAPKDDGEEFPWLVVVGGAAAIAAAIAGLVFLKKRNPDADVRVRRTAGDADHRVKGAYGSGEGRVKDFIGSGQQKFKQLIGLGGDHSDDEGYGHGFDDGDFYKVKSGDNMEKIARKTGKKSWHDIAEENPSIRNPNLIYPGDRLRV